MAKAKVQEQQLRPAWPAEKVTMWPLSQILPYERNAREHPKAQIDLLAKMMTKHGIDQPIVVDEQGVILKGHGRLLAAMKAGFAEFPVVMHTGLSDTDKRGMRIADNKVALLAGWDETVLRLEMDDLRMSGFDMEFTGFDESALKDLKIIKDDPLPTEESSAVVPGVRGVSIKFDMLPADRSKVVAWLSHERDRRQLRTTAEALVALADEATK